MQNSHVIRNVAERKYVKQNKKKLKIYSYILISWFVLCFFQTQSFNLCSGAKTVTDVTKFKKHEQQLA